MNQGLDSNQKISQGNEKRILDLQSNQKNTNEFTSNILNSEENIDGQSSISPSKSILKSKSKENIEKKKSVGFTLSSSNKDKEDEEEKTNKQKKNRNENDSSKILNESLSNNDPRSYVAVHNLSVGKVQDGIAVLLSEDFNVIEIPLSILPPDVRKGNIIKISIERNINEEESRKNSIKNIQEEIIKNDHLFDDFNRKLDYFKNKKMQLLQASSKGVPNVQKTLETVIGTLKETSFIDETLENDRIMIRPKAVTDIRLEKNISTGKQTK